MVLPSILVLPLWLAVANVLPLFQTLHALKDRTPARKTWLCYWIGYVLVSWLTYYFEWVLRCPFYMLSFVFVDLYCEAQLCLVLYLVLPSVLGIETVVGVLEKNASVYGSSVKKVFQDGATKALKLMQLQSQ
uniref:TB2/DP1 HVA22 family protein n=1 Tax=Pfiesteria piscicida TaxID=71001 RepID=A3E3K3_PFIPI|nr:TB2/DP1 HVA22 family protein [Pfiesteria piscicida]ABI14271.1 TB2/DP1 HVA22 family protein [Pfiesteria piscicida]ABI14272.1 TB2/DP1 HVA22 family protein [Pfiesteria piscicida]ABI14273.1 TB2/DP1 HVA22 family protein [Pfiesteria piscicida]